MAKEYNISKSTDNQSEVVKNGSPAFAPRTGICWNCRKNIYERRGYIIENNNKKYVSDELAKNFTGISVEESKSLVTGCPHCNRSYCD